MTYHMVYKSNTTGAGNAYPYRATVFSLGF